MKKYIFNFKSKVSNKINLSKNILGGKGANLSEMGRMGLPVPPGFTISTEVCELFYKNKRKINHKILGEIDKELKNIEKEIDLEVNDAVEFALKAPEPDPSELTKYIWAEN